MPRTPRPWFRLYSDILDNLKAEELKPALRWQWVKLLALANVTVPRGQLPAMKIVAYRLRVTETAALAIVLELVAHRLIDCTATVYVMHDWDEWQADRDVHPDKRAGKREIDHANVTPTLQIDHANGAISSEEYHAPSVKTRGERVEREEEKKEIRGEGDGDPIDCIAGDFAQFGKVTAGTPQAIVYAVKDFSLEWVQMAVRRTASSGAEDKPPWSYVESILERWKEQGHPDEPQPTRRNGTARRVPAGGGFADAADRFGARLGE